MARTLTAPLGGGLLLCTCPMCQHEFPLDWNPYTSNQRTVTCPSCLKVADIEWDDDNGWFAWLSPAMCSPP